MIDLFLASNIVLLCALISRITYKIGVPVLLAFVTLGMLVGENGLLHISFNDYALSEFICTVALIFIMFYGGFGTNWVHAKPVISKSSVLASIGVVFTTVFTALICFFILGIPIYDAFLLGAVLSATDAASVFSLLRSKNLGLKENTASLLEVESGSNDPFAYMLTIIVLSLMGGDASGFELIIITIKQLAFGTLCGGAIAWLTVRFLTRYTFPIPGFDMAFIIGIALFAYSVPTTIGGNGFLSVYIAGIACGNCRLKDKTSLIHFFDGFTSLMQMLIFFLLGFLAVPSMIPQVFIQSVIIWIFLTAVARPLAVELCFIPFKSSLPQKLLVSFAGLRGASSIVFAIMATVHEAITPGYLFHTVFCIVLLSIVFQGSLLAPVARLLKMCDDSINDAKSFNDYTEENKISFVSLDIYDNHPWINKAIHEVHLPPAMLIIMLLRQGKNVLQSGNTIFNLNDTVVLCAPKHQENINIILNELSITENSQWQGKTIEEFAATEKHLVVMILRDTQTIIPNGKTIINKNDSLVLAKL